MDQKEKLTININRTKQRKKRPQSDTAVCSGAKQLGGIVQIWIRKNAEFHVIISVSVATLSKKLDRY